MEYTELKDKIVVAYEDATPDILDRIKESCANISMTADTDFFDEKNYNRAKKIVSFKVLQTVVVAAALILVCIAGIKIGSISRIDSNTDDIGEKVVVETAKIEEVEEVVETETLAVPVVAAAIYIDVNPSIKITVDDKKKVIECTALNQDAKIILQETDVKGQDVSIAIKALVGTLYMHGYLQEDTSAILVSVDTIDTKFVEEVEKQVKNEVQKKETESKDEVKVVVQKVDSKKYEEKAANNNISVGKMEFIENIIETSEKYTEDNVEELSKLSIRILYDIWNTADEVLKDNNGDVNKNTNDKNTNDKNTNNVKPNNEGEKGNESTKGVAEDIVDTTLDTTEKIVDSTLDMAEDIVDSTLNTAEDIVEDTTKAAETIVEETLNNIFGVFFH